MSVVFGLWFLNLSFYYYWIGVGVILILVDGDCYNVVVNCDGVFGIW